jgi:two-component system response regulator MprA
MITDAPATDVLLVDDDADILTVTQFVLEGSGYSVRTATNGREALALLDDGLRPSVVLLDLMMPLSDGWSFLGELARRPSEPPIVVLSGANLTDDQVRALHVRGYLRKPVDLSELLDTVEHFCHAPTD